LLKNNKIWLEQLFKEYERFTKVSGIHLNADKTEIISPLNHQETHEISYKNEIVKIRPSKEIKICGKTYSYYKEIETKRNVEEKIEKLEKQLIIWTQRDLTIEGKITIVKIFGLSQVIYFMQNTYFDYKQINKIEGIIYKFIWTKGKWNGKHVERIKRNILKNEYSKGGLKAPDVQAIDSSLKTINLIRVINSESNYTKNLTEYHLHKAGNLAINSQYYQTGTSGNFFIDEGLRGINQIFKLFNEDLNTLMRDDYKINKR